MTLRKWFMVMMYIAAGMMVLPLTGLAEDNGPLTLVYTGDIEGKINPVPQ